MEGRRERGGRVVQVRGRGREEEEVEIERGEKTYLVSFL